VTAAARAVFALLVLATFGAFFDWHVYPVVEIGEVAAAASEAVEFLGSVS